MADRSNGTRRQGIFWIFIVPAPNELCGKMASQSELPEGVVWATGQLERGDQTDYEHYQICVAFSKKVSLAGVRRVFGAVHAELSRSEAAAAYCTKEETRIGQPFELGAKPFRRNNKVDWEQVWVSAKSGDVESIPASVRVVSYRTIRAIGSDYLVPKAIDRRVDVFWGRTGTGKSRRAWDEAGMDAYGKDPRTKFWDGYQNQQHVIIDEFRGGTQLN